MGEHVIGRPIGPSYVPGTLKGQSSPFASSLLPSQNQASPNQPVNPTPPLPGPAQTAPTGSNIVNPSQGPRGKLWDGMRRIQGGGMPVGSDIKVAGQYQAPSAIGTGLRRSSG